MLPPNEPQAQLPTTVQTHQVFWVVAADMATYNSHNATIDSYQTVLACAEDEYHACDIARHALEDGMIPIAAYDRKELLAMMDILAGHPLKPGETYNLAHQRTDAEMREWLDE